MKAVVIERFGDAGALSYKEVPRPIPGPGEIRIRVAACGVNRSDLRIRSGGHWRPIPLPRIPGSEFTGFVDGIGDGVAGCEPGDVVAVLPWMSCGRCESCHRGAPETCQDSAILGWERDGGYAELATVPESNVLPLPAGLDPVESAAVVLSATTALHMVQTIGKVRAGETVLVLAAGSGLGAYAIQIAKLLGAQVLATAGSDEKLAKAEGLGAIPVDHRDPAFGKEVRRLTGGRDADLVIEHVGPATWAQSIESLATGGRIVTAGATTGAKVEVDLLRLYARQISIHGALRGRREELEKVLQLTASGSIVPVIDRIVPLSEAPDAHRALENREVFGKILLRL